MEKDPRIFIEYILECIELIGDYTKGVTKEDFLKSQQLQDSVIRRIEVIGEAIKNIPREIRDLYLDIPWKRIAGTRDILIHEYWGIDLNLTWEVVVGEIPDLKREMLRIRKEIEAING